MHHIIVVFSHIQIKLLKYRTGTKFLFIYILILLTQR